MCQSVPCEVVEVQGQWALVKGTIPDLRTSPPLNPPLAKGGTVGGVESGLSHHGLNHTHRVYLGLLKDVRIGDYLLVHRDMAINKVEKDDAEMVLGLTCA